MDFPVVFRSHGGRGAAIENGDLHIDVAFLGAPSCDPYGNANGYSREADQSISCGSLGYARVDAKYADKVVILTNNLVKFPNSPYAIPSSNVDYVVLTDNIGDPKGITGEPPDSPTIRKNCSSPKRCGGDRRVGLFV